MNSNIWYLPILYASVYNDESMDAYLTLEQIDEINTQISKILDIPKPYVNIKLIANNGFFKPIASESNKSYTDVTIYDMKNSWIEFIRRKYHKKCTTMCMLAIYNNAKKNMIKRIKNEINRIHISFLI
jgi:hypothetical protein